jgi:hypothetical protein
MFTAKNAAYNIDGNEKELETIAVFRAIARQVATPERGLDQSISARLTTTADETR